MIIFKTGIKGLLYIVCSGFSIFSLIASAQVVDFTDCQSISARQERFACYDGMEREEEEDGGVDKSEMNENITSGNGSQSSLSNQRDFAAEPPVVTLPESQQTATSEEVFQDASEDLVLDVDGFGLGTEVGATPVLNEVDGKFELIDTVVAMRQNRPGMWLLTLASGQRWQQTITKRYFLKIGEEIRIYPTSWGSSFRLTSKRLRGYIQVKRLD